jgi:histidinol-phosphate phosphatase family protein
LKKQFSNKKRKAVFLDRDGVINKRPKEHDYVKSWEEFEFLPGVAETISRLNKDFLVVVVSNQRGISRGLMTSENLEEINLRMKSELGKKSARIDKIYFCPHGPQDNCNCRKPKPGMILKAAKDLNIDLNNSYIIGDSLEDIEAGKLSGCKTIFLGNAKNFQGPEPDFIIDDISKIWKTRWFQ